MTRKATDFTQGSIVREIVLFSVPLILGELLQTLYNSVDALVVGNFVSQHALAAVTVCGTVTDMIVNFFNGMSVGSNVVVAMALGHGDRNELRTDIRATFSFGVVLGIALSLLGFLFAPQLLQFAGTQESYLADAMVYLRIYLAGLVFTVVYNNAAGILRALGRSDVPFRILVITCVMNIVLDLLFTAVLQWGIAGAGIATVIAQATSAILAYHAINREIGARCFDLRVITRDGQRAVSQMMRVGFAAGMQSALIGFSNIFVVRYMNMYPAESVAGIGIAQRLDRFVILPAKTFGITMTTFVGQNIGAKQYNRIDVGKRHCAAVAVAFTLVLSAIVYFFADTCVALFSPNPEVIAVGVAMMHVIAPMFWPMALREVLLGVLRGCGKNLWPTVLSLVGMIGVRQTYLAVTMHYDPAIENIYRCYPIAWAATLTLLVIYYLAVRKALLPEH